jgi:hypothetical protein
VYRITFTTTPPAIGSTVSFSSEAGQQITRVTPVSGTFLDLGNGFNVVRNFPIATPTVTGATYQPPEFPAIDSANNAWIPLQTIYSPTGTTYPVPGLEKVSTTGGVTSYYSGTGTNTTTKIYTGANFY